MCWYLAKGTQLYQLKLNKSRLEIQTKPQQMIKPLALVLNRSQKKLKDDLKSTWDRINPNRPASPDNPKAKKGEEFLKFLFNSI